MSSATSSQVTELLVAWNNGDRSAFDRLIPIVHSELHRLARRYMRDERAGHMLQTTALVNEAYLRLIDARRTGWQNRAHFFGIAARLMRRILVDFARERNYQKRSGGMRRVVLEEAQAVSSEGYTDVVGLDEALNALAEVDERKSKVVEMRFFGGLSEREIAAALTVSRETVRRDWRLAKAWLLRWLSEEHSK